VWTAGQRDEALSSTANHANHANKRGAVAATSTPTVSQRPARFQPQYRKDRRPWLDLRYLRYLRFHLPACLPACLPDRTASFARWQTQLFLGVASNGVLPSSKFLIFRAPLDNLAAVFADIFDAAAKKASTYWPRAGATSVGVARAAPPAPVSEPGAATPADDKSDSAAALHAGANTAIAPWRPGRQPRTNDGRGAPPQRTASVRRTSRAMTNDAGRTLAFQAPALGRAWAAKRTNERSAPTFLRLIAPPQRVVCMAQAAHLGVRQNN